jgi:radical SAM superfamily enzyme YgiQ (UPF0313 family)
MRVALVQPFVSIEEGNFPIGITYLHQSLLDRGHEAEQFDVNYTQDIRADLTAYKPDFVGFTLFEWDTGKARPLVDFAKSIGARTIIGGPSVTINAERCLRQLDADISVSGDGVFAIHDAINGNLSATGIGRLSEGKFVGNGYAPSRIDEWPTPKYPRKIVNGWARLASSTGCYANCSFCSVHQIFPNIRTRSVKKILEDMLTINAREPGLTGFYFQNDNSFMNLRQLREVLEGMSELNIPQKISYSARANQIIKSEDILRANMGRIDKIDFGAESFVQSQLDRWMKGVTREQNIEAIDVLLRNGICPEFYIISFDRESSNKEFKEVCAFFAENPFYFFFSNQIHIMYYPQEPNHGYDRYHPSRYLKYATEMMDTFEICMKNQGLQNYRNAFVNSRVGLRGFEYTEDVLARSRAFFSAVYEHSIKIRDENLKPRDEKMHRLYGKEYDLTRDLILEIRKDGFAKAGLPPPNPKEDRKGFQEMYIAILHQRLKDDKKVS